MNSALGTEVGEDAQRCAARQLQVALPADAPAAPTVGLQQEDVVGVDVRTDAAAVGGVADHQIVEPRIGHEAEPLQQCVRAVVEQIDALDENRPARAAVARAGA